MKFNSIIWSNIRTNRATKQGFEPTSLCEPRPGFLHHVRFFQSLQHALLSNHVFSLYSGIRRWLCWQFYCVHVHYHQPILTDLSHEVNEHFASRWATGSEKKKKSMTIWASKWIRESKSSLCAFSWRESQDPVVRRQTQCWWLKAGAQASLWLGIRLLFSFHKLISRWIWIISTLRRQNPVCGSLLCSSRPVSLLIIFHLLSPPLILPVCIFLCCYPQTPLLAEECPCVLQFSPVSINSALHSAFLIWSPNFVQSLIN